MKRKTRTFRVRASLDARLIAAAHANERSVSEEIEHRLELAFDYTDACARGEARSAWYATLTSEEKCAHGRKIAVEAVKKLRALIA